MSLTEKTVTSVGSVESNGVVFVRKVTTVYRDGQPFGAPQVWRGPLHPGADISDQDHIVAAVCNAVWTPEVVAAFKAAEAARRAATNATGA
jgi:hypothetical protein